MFHMRALLMLLVFAIGFGGYSAAAHAVAFGPDDVTTVSRTADSGDEGCASHLNGPDQKQGGGQGQSSKAKCFDCVHCGMGHALYATDYAIGMYAATSTPFLLVKHRRAGDHRISFLRPPRPFV